MQYLILICSIVIADQGLKYAVVHGIGMTNQIPVIDGFFYINCISNNGIAMGMFAEHQSVVIIVTACIMIAIVGYVFAVRKKEKPSVLLILTMIAGGGIGNLIDRVRLGYVIDFIDFRIWSYIFNFADICVVAGCFMLVFIAFRDMWAEKKSSGTKNEEF